MINIKEDEKLNILNHSCAHLLAQAVKHLYPNAKFWVGPVISDGFYYDIDLGDDVIKEEDLPRIFERGFTGYNGRMDKKASGLGLYLCKRIIDNLGYKISITSKLGQGTCVCIDFHVNEFQLE